MVTAEVRSFWIVFHFIHENPIISPTTTNLNFFIKGGKYNCAVYRTFPFNVFVFVGCTTFRSFFRILFGLFIKLSVKTFQPLIVIYRWSNFVSHHCRITSIFSHCLITFICLSACDDIRADRTKLLLQRAFK